MFERWVYGFRAQNIITWYEKKYLYRIGYIFFQFYTASNVSSYINLTWIRDENYVAFLGKNLYIYIFETSENVVFNIIMDDDDGEKIIEIRCNAGDVKSRNRSDWNLLFFFIRNEECYFGLCCEGGS